MKAIVLMGGFGTRLRPLTNDTPKQMLPIVGITMFERVITRLGQCGVDEVVVSLGFRPDRFIDAFPDGVCAGVSLHYAVEPAPLDTAGAIAFAAAHGGIDETFLVLNGDVLGDLDFSWLVAQHRSHGGEATLHLTAVAEPSRFGVVVTDDDERVTAFIEKPAPGTEPSNLINAGTYVFEPSVLELIESGRKVSVERETFPKLVERGQLFAVATADYWLDAGTPSAYLAANLDLIDGTRGSESAVHPTAQVDPTANIERSCVGAGAVIGPEAVVRGSVIMENAHIGARAQVLDSIVASGGTVGTDAIVAEESICGFGAAVEDGASLIAGREPLPQE